MSKLLQLKEWVTIKDASRHLSIVLNEEIIESDLLQLAIEQKLSLSVFFVDPVRVRKLKKNSFSIPACYPLKNLEKLYISLFPMEHEDDLLCMEIGRESIDEDYFGYSLYRTDKIFKIKGVCDLASSGYFDIANEYLIHKFNKNIASKEDGYIVETVNKFSGCEIFELLSTANESGHSLSVDKESKLKELEQHLEKRNIDNKNIETQADKKDSLAILSVLKDEKSEDYHPMRKLPDNSFFVIRTEVLSKFINSVNMDVAIKKQESTRKTENLLRALTAIAIDDYGYDPRTGKSTAPQDIVDAMNNQGVSFDAKTVRNWLKDGASLLSISKKNRLN